MSRLLAPADTVFFVRPDYRCPSGRLFHRASRAADWPPAPPGMMRLSQAEIERIEFRRLGRIKRRAGERFRPVLYRELGADEARRVLSRQSVSRSVDEGYGLGFRSERSLYQWSLLQTSSAGHLGRDPRILQYLRSERTGLSAEGQLDAVFKRLAHLNAINDGSST